MFFVLRWHNRDWSMFILNDFISDIYIFKYPLKDATFRTKVHQVEHTLLLYVPLNFIRKTSRRKRIYLPLDQHLANVLQQLVGSFHIFANFNTFCVSVNTFSSYSRKMEIMYVFSQKNYLDWGKVLTQTQSSRSFRSPQQKHSSILISPDLHF